jgi:hypothetical protein
LGDVGVDGSANAGYRGGFVGSTQGTGAQIKNSYSTGIVHCDEDASSDDDQKQYCGDFAGQLVITGPNGSTVAGAINSFSTKDVFDFYGTQSTPLGYNIRTINSFNNVNPTDSANVPMNAWDFDDTWEMTGFPARPSLQEEDTIGASE